jgi:hypothetical protein
MKKNYVSFFLLIFLAAQMQAVAQQTVLRSLKVTKVYAGEDHDDFNQDEYRWRFWLNEVSVGGCVSENAWSPGWFNKNITLASNLIIPHVSNGMALRMENWEDDTSPSCAYNSGDDSHCNATNHFSFSVLAPGITHTIQKLNCRSEWGVEYTFSYDVPTPSTPAVAGPVGIICESNPQITLSTTSFIGSAFVSQSTLLWEYYTPQTGWRLLRETPGSNFTFTTNGLRQLPGINNITVNTEVRFRVRSKFQDFYYSAFSSASNAIYISPLAPVINFSGTSCLAEGTGKINVSTSTIQSQLGYVLRAGYNPSPCSPDGGNCGGALYGRVFNSTFEIQPVPSGVYTLIVSNPGGPNGVCYSYVYPLVVDCEASVQITGADVSSNQEEGIETAAIQSESIKSISSTPNPNHGDFEVSVNLSRSQALTLVVYDTQGAIHHSNHWDKIKNATAKISVSKSGVYMVKAITERASKWIRVCVSR